MIYLFKNTFLNLIKSKKGENCIFVYHDDNEKDLLNKFRENNKHYFWICGVNRISSRNKRFNIFRVMW